MPQEFSDTQEGQAELARLREALARLEDENRGLREAQARLEAPPAWEDLQQALRQSEEKFRLAFWTNPDLCCITRARDGAFIEVNPGFEAVSGYSRQEILGSNSLALNFYPDPQVRRQLVEDLAAHGQVRGREVEFRARDGRIIHTLMSMAVFTLDGEPHILSTIKVIDDLRAAQESLAQSEERYRRIVETANEGIWAVDQEERTTFVNQRLAGMLGYTSQEMLGRTVASFVLPEDLADYQAHLAQRRSGLGGHYERRFRRQDGSHIWTLISSTPIMDDQGRLAGSFAMLTDITGRKAAEENIQRLNQGLEEQVRQRTASLAESVARLESEIAQHQQARQDLEASNQKYCTLLEHTLQGVAILEGDPAHFAYVNPRMTEIFGYSAQEFGGLGPEEMWKLVHPEDREMARQRALTRLAGQGPAPRYEFRIVRKDGGLRWVEVFSAPTEHQGRPASQVAYIDITERKQAEEALRQSEEKFSKAFRHSPALMALTVLEDGTYLDVNDKFLDLLGMPREEVIGRTSVDIGWLKAGDRRQVVETLKTQGRVSGLEITSYQRDGTPVPCSYHCELVNIGGKQRLLTIALDMSERKRAEKALRQSEERYRLLVESANEGIVVAQDGLVKFFNQRMVEIIGLSLTEDGIKPFLEYVHPEDRLLVLDRYQKRLAGDATPYHDPVRIIDKQGQVKWLQPSSVLIQWEGRPAYLGFFTDITQSKYLEQELAESEKRYRLISENALDIVVLRDAQMRGLYVSPSVKRVLGYEPQEFLDTPLLELLHPEDAQGPPREAMANLQKGQGEVYIQNRVRRKDGSYVWLEVLTAPMRDEAGGITGFLAAARDISERRRAEDALLHLAAGVAHNFNNVLMASLSNAQAAQGLLARGQAEPERLGELLENVAQAALGGRDVVHRLSRFVSGRQEQTSSAEMVDLGQLLAALPGLVGGMTAPGRVRLDLRTQENLVVKGVAGELMEVFLNLAKNAAEAMPLGGVLEVSARAEGQLAVIEFNDNGMGADQATLARFFEPFFSTKGAQGQGLGLSVSLAIARGHGGDLSARSQPGQGTTLTVRLPLGREALATGPASPRAAQAGPLKVLLVEDEGLVAMGMTLTLESAGHQVLHVVTMAGALAIMEQFRPHLAVCDLGLPDATGWEVCARLESQARELGLKHLPLVVLSGWGREQLGALPPGAPQPFAYLQKPVERARLLEVIAQAVQQPPG
ncbi:MAG: PAS domain S-box protein [Desulfarculus sp.]|nr:PAS domain S-box protein [Desulfarculus sp.]